MPEPSEAVWYKDKRKLRLGDVCRYTIVYTNRNPNRTGIFFRLKNLEKTGLRAIHLLNGPFILYCHVVPCNYTGRTRFTPDDADADNEVRFHNSIKPGQTFNVPLRLNGNSRVRQNADGSSTHQWSVDVVCQVVLNRRASLQFVVVVGDDLVQMRRETRSVLTSLTKGDFHVSWWESDHAWGTSTERNLAVACATTDDIWSRRPRLPKEPVHLVIVTHGIFSNLTADMLYLRDALSSLPSDNYLVEGFRGNAGRTEKGIHRLGVGVATYVADLLADLRRAGTRVARISFVAHSLGGPVQLYALKHLVLVHGADYFDRQGIALGHFVCLASPMLGVLSEMSLWISWFLDLGTLGKSGRDLTLSKKLPSVKPGHHSLELARPILETLPDEPVQTLLKNFQSRTVYANAVNDGIVPLRTSALLYLDWEALGDVKQVKNRNGMGSWSEPGGAPDAGADPADSDVDDRGEPVGQIPDDSSTNMTEKYSSFLARIFNFDSASTNDSHKTTRAARRIKRYAQISARGRDQNAESIHSHGSSDAEKSGESSPVNISIPPKASAVESAINSLICPIPSSGYINDPEARDPVIFHDKYYHFDTMPARDKRTGGIKKFFHYYDWRMDKQVKIARKYHVAELSWRKVLVCLPPDAHNNIVVRRRFANGYGWGVVEHLQTEVFGDQRMVAKF